MAKAKLELLIREIDPSTKNGRYLRENLRRIKQYLDSVGDGTIELISYASLGAPTIFDGVYRDVATSNGQTNFTLPDAPATPDLSRMLVNGAEMTYYDHFSISGNTLTFDPTAAGFDLETSNEFGQPDAVTVYYIKG